MKTSVSHKSSRDFTKSCIMEALLQLMHSKDYNDISITDITSRAGVSRMAYYRNYRSKDHILMDYMCRLSKSMPLNWTVPNFSLIFRPMTIFSGG